MAHTVLSVSSRALLAACKELGLDEAALVQLAGCDRSVIDNPDGRLAPEQVFALWDEAYRLSGDEHLGLRVARAVPPGAYRALEYLIQSAPTVRAACAKVCEYFAWIDTSARLVVVECDGLMGFSLEIDAPPVVMPLRAVEFTFATCFEKLRPALGGALPVARVDWAGSGPSDVRPLAEFLGCPVLQGATGNRMLFEPDVWERANGSADAKLYELLDRHARSTLDHAIGSRSASGRVRQLLLGEGEALTISAVAKKLGLSVRTLQRRLADEGFVFAQIVDDVRGQLARSFVSDRGLALVEVALLLGFSDQSSFTRSFKRWTGQTPTAYRAQTYFERTSEVP